MDAVDYGIEALSVPDARVLLRTNEGLVMACFALCIGITSKVQDVAVGKSVDVRSFVEKVLPMFEEYLIKIVANEERYALLPEYRAELLRGFAEPVIALIVEMVEKSWGDEEAKPSV